MERSPKSSSVLDGRWRDMAQTRIEILDSSQQLITWVKTPMPINSAGDILQYSKELSDFGQCRFRVSAYDPDFATDILKPHYNHIRIVRNGATVWQGAIIENAKRTKDYIEVTAAEYEWYLGRILINRTSTDPNTGTKDNIYRIFNSGTMSAAVTTLMNETITNYKNSNSAHPLANLTLGTIDNPNYPPNLQDGSNKPKKLTGPWRFGNGITSPQLTFDFHTVLYVLKAFGNYTYADFEIDENLTFNFRSFLGNDLHYDINFTWGKHGNAIDFNFPRLGQMMANDLIGIATDNNGTILHAEQTDQTSISSSGIIQSVAAFADVKDQAALNARVQAELPLISNPEESPVNMVLSEKAYPLGQYDIGDIITCNINHTAVSLSAIKRIVGISVNLHDTGRETITVQLNTPLPSQYGAV